MCTRHVILLTYGEPPRADLIAQLRYSWRILLGLTRSVADIPAPLLPVIALMRAATRATTWTRERFGSPLEPLTHEQAAALQRALVTLAPGTDWRVHVAYEFRDPLLADCFGALPGDEPVDIVPAYVADSAFTHQLARDTLARWLSRSCGRPAPISVLPPLPAEDLAELSARHLMEALGARGVRGGPDHALILAAHGTLLAPPKAYETGRIATEAIAAGIARRVGHAFGRVELGWLNHVYGGRWTEPAAHEALASVCAAGFKKAVYFPFGFLADNAESLLEGRQVLRTQPGLEAVHVPCLNAERALIDALARQIAASGERERLSRCAGRAPVELTVQRHPPGPL